MHIVISPTQTKPEHREEYIEALVNDARGSVNNEPGCLRFDVIQDSEDQNRIWVYEIYKDEAAFQAHLQAPHLLTFREIAKDWRDEAPKGAGRGSYNIWPSDSEWK